jgi:serine/threonine protein kinase
VYEAEHELLGVRRALKVLSRQLADREDLAERLRLEARALAQLHHPHLVQVLDLGVSSDGRVFFAMELLVGATLRDVVVSRGRLAPATAVDIACEILDALHEAHERGMVHRDVKPENIWVQESGTAKLLDFGVAKAVGGREGHALTQQGTTVGTPRYMAPEQAESATVDRRVDVFAVGLVLWECLVGRTPFAELDAMAAMVAAVMRGIPSVGAALPSGSPVPPQLIACIDRATSRKPDDRFPTAADLRRELLSIRPLLGQAEAGPTMVSRGLSAAIAGALGAANTVGAAHVASYAPTEDALTQNGAYAQGSTSGSGSTVPDLGVATMPMVPSVQSGRPGAEGTARIPQSARASAPSYPPQSLDRRASPTPTAVPIASVSAPPQVHTQPLSVPSGSGPGSTPPGEMSSAYFRAEASPFPAPPAARRDQGGGGLGTSPRAFLLLPLGVLLGGIGVLIAIKWAIPDPPAPGLAVAVSVAEPFSSTASPLPEAASAGALSPAAAVSAAPSASASAGPASADNAPIDPGSAAPTAAGLSGDHTSGEGASGKPAHGGSNPAGNARTAPPRSGPLPKSGL